MLKEIKNYHKEKYCNEGEIYFPLFGKDIKINVGFDVDNDYLEKCLIRFENLKDSTIDKFCEAAIRYCEDYREDFESLDINIPRNIVGRDIMKYINPISLVIEKTSFEVPTFSMECDCDWEEEHGMALTILDDQVLYVGPFESAIPYDEERKEYIASMPGNYISNN